MVPLRALFPSAARGNPRAAAPARVVAGPARLPGLRSRTPTAQQHGPAQVRQPADPAQPQKSVTVRVRIDDIDLVRQHHHDSRSDQALTVNHHNFPRTGSHPANPEERRVPDPIPEVAPHPAETTLPPTIPLSSPAGTSPALRQAKKRRRPEPERRPPDALVQGRSPHRTAGSGSRRTRRFGRPGILRPAAVLPARPPAMQVADGNFADSGPAIRQAREWPQGRAPVLGGIRMF